MNKNQDILLPEDMEIWSYVEYTIKKVMKLYNFKEVRTQIIQKKSLYNKLMAYIKEYGKYSSHNLLINIEDDETLCLRPEGTLTILNSQIVKEALIKTQKVFYHGPMFIKNPPLSLRLSEDECLAIANSAGEQILQFNQIGAEILGSDSIMSDVEIILLADKILQEICNISFTLEINSHGCEKCFVAYKEALQDFLLHYDDELCEKCKENTNIYPLAVYKCHEEACQKIRQIAPKFLDYLCFDCIENFKKIKKLLSNLGLKFIINPYLFLNFDYYSGLIFNFYYSSAEKNTILIKGGRYDGLSKYISEKPISAVGFSLNIEETMQLLKNKNIFHQKELSFTVCLLTLSANMELLILQIEQELHENDINTVIFENIFEPEEINDLIIENKFDVYLIFREDFIRDGNVLAYSNENIMDINVQNLIALSDILNHVKKNKNKEKY